MKRNYLLIVFVFVLPLLLGGCKDNEQKINPVKATTSQMKKQEDIVNDFMIMQVDNKGFPQSQGVFDYKRVFCISSNNISLKFKVQKKIRCYKKNGIIAKK